ncbi:MAG TPA: DNA mismatch repair protein MutS [Thermomicrobiales bacterium]|nr:DNA mismatch repair protein MutS [Thermomicrobiales bacterium]
MSSPSARNLGSGTDVVPLRRQYLQIKGRYPDTILFFRLGDFYETFDGDAEIAAQILDIVLTGREMGKNLRVPMAGIPYHAADGYIARLIAAGHKVAVCEQVGEVTKGKGLVERDVTRVITPGTVDDPAMLDARTNNYLVAVVAEGNRAGVAYADVTTGEFRTTELTGNDPQEALLAVGRELLRLHASEIVLPADLLDNAPLPKSSWMPERAVPSKTDAWRWQASRASDALTRHFNVDSLDGFGCAGKPFAIRAAGGLLQYLEETQLSGLKQIHALSTYALDGFMTLDAQTRRNLELSESSRGDRRHSLVSVLNQTRTPMGARLLNRWIGQPLLNLDAIATRHDAVEWFVNATDRREKVRDRAKAIGDLERLANRIVTGSASPRDLGTLRDSLGGIAAFTTLATELPGLPAIPEVSDARLLLTAALADEPPVALGKGPVFRPGYASELDAHRARAKEAREWIANLERQERDGTGIRTLKVGYNRVFGYYLEITAAALASAERDRLQRGEDGPALPAEYISKQTLANATRYFTPQLKEYETLVLTAEDTLASMEADIYRTLLLRLSDHVQDLRELAAAIAYVDTTSALAAVAVERNYVRPILSDSTHIEIEGGRHPVLETVLPAGEYVPNNALLDSSTDQVVILTGPNMAGKSSWLRQVALITLMAQIGSFVPADSARIGIVDRIFTRIGAQDDIATGQSTFMVEMLETASILHHATGRSLLVLDEIGRGTSTWDGLAIARAIVEYIHNSEHLGCKTLFATHYHELTELATILPRVKTYRMDVLEEGDQVIFLRQVVPGGADRSYGIHVAQLAGIPRGILRRAREILDELELDSPGGDRQNRREAMQRPAPDSMPGLQLTFFDQPNPVVERLSSLDVESMSPLEALTTLFELKRLAGDDRR